MRPRPLALALIALASSIPGCVAVAVAAVAAGAVHVTSEDSVEVYFDAPHDRVFDAAEQQVVALGGSPLSNRVTGRIEAEVGHSDVEVQVTSVGKARTRVEVQARKNEGVSPDVDCANQVAMGIAKRL